MLGIGTNIRLCRARVEISQGDTRRGMSEVSLRIPGRIDERQLGEVEDAAFLIRIDFPLPYCLCLIKLTTLIP